MKAASAFRVLFAPATFGQSIPYRKRQKSLGTALGLFLSLSTPLFGQTISYFNEGFLRQPSALADRNYLGVYGSNITGWGPSPPAPFVLKAGDTMTGALTNNDHISVNGTVYASKFQIGYTSMSLEYDPVLKKTVFKQNGEQTLELNTTALNGGVALGAQSSAANTGVAVGMNAIGYNTGVGVGVNAQGYDNGAAVGNATVANNFGTAIGDTAHGADYAVAAGHNSSSGSAYSIAIGSYANVDGSKKVGMAIGPGATVGADYGLAIGTTNGAPTSPAQVDGTAPGAVEIGSGTATVPWALHYRGVPLADSNGIVVLGSLPPGILTNNWNGPRVTLTNSSLLVTGAQFFAVSNGPSYVLITNGSLSASTSVSAVGTQPAVHVIDSTSVLRLTAGGAKTYLQSGINFTSNSKAEFHITSMLNGTDWLTILTSGNVGIGITAPPEKLTVIGNETISGTIKATNSITSLASMTATNFYTSAIKWVDMNINYALSVSGPTAPDLVSVTNPAAGSLIKQLAFDNNDELFGQCQLPHTLAITNASFPKFYTEPHVHFDTIGTLDAAHSNVTWRIEWEWANINGGWTRGTNQATMGVTNNFTHYMLELGHITNDPPMNISAIFRCRLTRPASASEEYDSAPNSHTVILDAFDLHVPIGNQNAIGSSTDNAP